MMNTRVGRARVAVVLAALVTFLSPVQGQEVRTGAPVSPAHRRLHERGAEFIISQQADGGSWESSAGVSGICIMALLASGQDPNHGKYADSIRRGLRSLIAQQSRSSGQIGSGMYEHGFAMLCLADCFGALDERLFEDKDLELERSIGESLRLAVRCAVTSQKQNPFKAWRYSPSSSDADSSVTGAILMGLLGARNAGVPVPDESIENALGYLDSMTTESGTVSYSGTGGFGDSLARSSIVALCRSVAKRPLPDDALRSYVVSRSVESTSSAHPCYSRYYVSQALFQLDHAAWRAWSAKNTNDLLLRQGEDGRIVIAASFQGPAYQTAMLLLSGALEYTLLPVYER
ncbi:squalene--hopene cyclase [bacterium]|jgi:hypothetical protein|nr:squalene--hopene cyclase [bacterium]